MKRSIFIITGLATVLSLAYCSGGGQQNNAGGADTTKKASATQPAPTGVESKGLGIGRFKDIVLSHPLNDSMVNGGEMIFNSKCIACHKLTDEKLVGPGWKGITDRRKPEWIMNFITNTDVMLDSDLVAEQVLAVCVTRMPNQNVSDQQARSILEFMRKNDGKN